MGRPWGRVAAHTAQGCTPRVCAEHTGATQRDCTRRTVTKAVRPLQRTPNHDKSGPDADTRRRALDAQLQVQREEAHSVRGGRGMRRASGRGVSSCARPLTRRPPPVSAEDESEMASAFKTKKRGVPRTPLRVVAKVDGDLSVLLVRQLQAAARGQKKGGMGRRWMLPAAVAALTIAVLERPSASLVALLQAKRAPQYLQDKAARSELDHFFDTLEEKSDSVNKNERPKAATQAAAGSNRPSLGRRLRISRLRQQSLHTHLRQLSHSARPFVVNLAPNGLEPFGLGSHSPELLKPFAGLHDDDLRSAAWTPREQERHRNPLIRELDHDRLGLARATADDFKHVDVYRKEAHRQASRNRRARAARQDRFHPLSGHSKGPSSPEKRLLFGSGPVGTSSDEPDPSFIHAMLGDSKRPAKWVQNDVAAPSSVPVRPVF